MPTEIKDDRASARCSLGWLGEESSYPRSSAADAEEVQHGTNYYCDSVEVVVTRGGGTGCPVSPGNSYIHHRSIDDSM